MKWKSTLVLLIFAAGLFGYIFFYERHALNQPSGPPPLPLNFDPTKAASIQIRRGNLFVLRAEDTNGEWNLTAPFPYPAQSFQIEKFLETLKNQTGRTRISADDLNGRRQAILEYGFALPQAALTLEKGEQRIQIQFGAKTSVGDQVYIQVVGTTDIYVINSELVDLLPHSPNDWRDRRLIMTDAQDINRLELRAGSRSFSIRHDPDKDVYHFTKPMVARADQAKIEDLLRKVSAARVDTFVDDPKPDLDKYGLQSPEAELELAFDESTNDVTGLQFGQSPTNEPAKIYARLLNYSNIVEVPRSLLESIRIPFSELRDRQLLSFVPETVDEIDVTGKENFVVRRQTNGTWRVADPAIVADTEIMRDWLGRLSRLEVTQFVKDVVTDFSAYGLATPSRRYVLKSNAANPSNGAPTNQVLAELDFGTIQGNDVFVRRADENSVYSVSLQDFQHTPSAAWQLHDRQVFHFTTNEVTRVVIEQNGEKRELIRKPGGHWSFGAGSQGVINPYSLEETLYRLGQLRALVWVARGNEYRKALGFSDTGHKITFDLQRDKEPKVRTLEFGGFAPSQFPYATSEIDGQPWFFEFPWPLYLDILRDLSIHPSRTPPTVQ